MCGISGLIYKNHQNVNNTIVKDMNNIISHRGPDDEGFYFDKNLSFGHRRLSILDLSSDGHQPMHFSNKYTITYNGEVYNYLEIKDELIKEGYNFTTQTDTEVILASYDKWGEDCVHKFNGMWAFSIYDKLKNIIFCSRDRFGIKPFYYFDDNEIFSFASEMKQFQALPSFKATVDEDVVYNFLANSLFNYNENTFFKTIKQLMGGCNLIYDLNLHNFTTIKWYEIPEQSTEKSTFKTLFNESIKLRLRSDVKVGSCLSGGLDSSSIVCTVNNLIQKKELQEIVSACFEEKIFDEREYVDALVNEKNIISNKIFPQLDRLLDMNFLKSSIYIQDTPYTTTSVFSQYSVFEEAHKRGLKVMLDGQGADETLAGYHSFFPSYLASYVKKFQFTQFLKELNKIESINKINKTSIVLQLINTLLPRKIKYILKRENTNWINYDTFSTIDNKSPYITYGERDSHLQTFSKAQLFHTNLPLLLHYEDRNSMAHSIEARVPFLDYKLVEHIISLPDDLKIKDGVTKYILRDSLKEILPKKILNRKDKMGFVTPESIWAKKNADFFKKELEEAVNKSKFINKNILDSFNNFINGKEAYNNAYWRIITYSKWLDIFGVKE